MLLASFAHAENLPRSAPEEQGVSSESILGFVDACDKQVDSLHSVMLLRHGKVVAEGWWRPYRAEAPHQLFSLSKSFTSTAVGLAAAEGKLSIDDPVLKFFPDETPPEASGNLKSMRVRDLLCMSTGQQTEPPRPGKDSWTKAFLAHPVPFKPGTHFLYNTSGTYMQSAIVQKATGQNVLEYLRPRLFEPLGIEQPTWEMSPEGVATGGFGLSVRTEDIAKFGQLYLQRGKWQGKQLVPESWIDQATARQTSNGSNPQSDWDQGYGFQFWRCRNGAYRGDGAFGQYCVVMPKQDAVLAITGGLKDMQAVLNIAWEKLLPGFQEAAIPAADAARNKLTARLKSLSIPPQDGSGTPAKTADKTFKLASGGRWEAVSLKSEASDGATTIVCRIGGSEQKIVCPRGRWQDGEAAWSTLPRQKMAASGGWTADDTFTAKLCCYETPTIFSVTFQFRDGGVQVVSQPTVGFGVAKETLTGKAE